MTERYATVREGVIAALDQADKVTDEVIEKMGQYAEEITDRDKLILRNRAQLLAMQHVMARLERPEAKGD